MFKKEGGKVKGYYTTKKLILGAFKGFIVIVRMGHLINCIKLPKNFTLKLKIWPLNIQRKMAKNTLLNPKFAIFFILRHYFKLLGDEKRNIVVPGDFGLLCL